MNTSLDAKVMSLGPHVGSFADELRKLLLVMRQVGYPEGVLDTMMRLGLRLTSQLYEAAQVGKPPSDNLFSRVEDLARRGVLPDEMASYLHLVRVLSNKPHHDSEQVELQVADAENVLSGFLRVLEWFYREYGLAMGTRVGTIYGGVTCSGVGLPTTNAGSERVVGVNLRDASGHFMDRTGVLGELRELLRDPRAKLICVLGRGGMGKTTLVAKVCDEIEEGRLRLRDGLPEGFGADGIIYVSCRDGDRPTFERLVSDIARCLGTPHAEELVSCVGNPSLSVAEKTRFLVSKLRGGAYVVVLDNFEDTLTPENHIEDDALREFMEVCLTSSRSLRLLLTSREPPLLDPDVGQAVYDVCLDEGLPESDAVVLLRELDAQGRLGLRDGDDALLRRVARQCLGIPLALRRVVGILRADRRLRLVDLVERQDLFNAHVVTNLVSEQYRRVSDDQRRVVEALSVFGRPVPEEAVCALLATVHPGIHVDECLMALVNNYLADYDAVASTYQLHPLDRAHAYAGIPNTDSQWCKRNCHAWAGTYYLETAETQRGGRAPGQWRTWLAIEQQGWAEAIVEAASHLLMSDDPYLLSDVAELISKAYSIRLIQGFYDESLSMCDSMVSAARRTDDPHAEALWLHQRALQMFNQADYQAAEDACLEGLSAATGAADSLLEGHLLHREGMILQAKTEHSKARDMLLRAAEAKERAGEPAEVASALSQRAESLERVGQLETALSVHMRLSEVARSETHTSLTIKALGAIGRCARTLGRYDDAASALSEGVRTAAETRSVWAEALLRSEAALLALLQDDADAALEQSRIATGMARGIAWVGYRALVLLQAGVAYHALAQVSSARQNYEDVRRQNVADRSYCCEVRRGLLLRELGAKAEGDNALSVGVQECRTLLGREAQLYDALYHRALAQLALGRVDEALCDYRRALDICSAKGVVDAALLDLGLLERSIPGGAGICEARALLQAHLA